VMDSTRVSDWTALRTGPGLSSVDRHRLRGLVATGLGSDAGITGLLQVVSLLNAYDDDAARAAAHRLKELVDA